MNILKGSVDELESKNKIIEEQIAFKERLLANVNHELRTPLNAIIGMSSLLQDTELNKVQEEYTQIIKRSGDSLFTIINDFLTMSSVKEGKIALKIRPFSLNELLSDLSIIFRKQTASKGIDLNISKDVATPDYLLGDATRVNQILQNLLTNAIKFTSHGKVQLFVKEVEDLNGIKMIEFKVSDTGIGIPLDKQATIFDSFTQAHTAGNRDYMGTGLGLNIVKSLTEIMEGEVSMQSEENKGTKVSIRLPLKIASNNVNEGKVKEEDSIPSSWKKKKFLMIEDNVANIIYAQELFTKWDLDIVFKETYTEGLKEANDNFYDLILSDLKLPDGNGIDLLKSVRSNKASACNKTKLSVITASISQADKNRAVELNISSYIEKPFLPETLLSELHKIFEDSAPLKNRIILDNEPKVAESDDVDVTKLLNVLESITSKESVQHKFIAAILDQFRIDLPQLEMGIKENDFKQIADTAHKLKSSMGILKLEAMSKEVAALERIAKSSKDEEEINKLWLSFSKNVDINLPKLRKIKSMLEQKMTA
jgi:nitrogen-specific signal transduction histidine kinase/DNA-binding response OmpR family regulator